MRRVLVLLSLLAIAAAHSSEEDHLHLGDDHDHLHIGEDDDHDFKEWSKFEDKLDHEVTGKEINITPEEAAAIDSDGDDDVFAAAHGMGHDHNNTEYKDWKEFPLYIGNIDVDRDCGCKVMWMRKAIPRRKPKPKFYYGKNLHGFRKKGFTAHKPCKKLHFDHIPKKKPCRKHKHHDKSSHSHSHSHDSRWSSESHEHRKKPCGKGRRHGGHH